MGAWTVKQQTCWDRMLVKLRKRDGDHSIFEIVTSTNDSARRSASQNAAILAIQKAKGRNPWFLSAQERKQLEAKIADTVRRLGLSGLADLATAIGTAMVDFYREHIRAGKSARGTMAPLAESTEARKAKQGHGGEPILVETGQLRDSITFTVKQVN